MASQNTRFPINDDQNGEQGAAALNAELDAKLDAELDAEPDNALMAVVHPMSLGMLRAGKSAGAVLGGSSEIRGWSSQS